MEPRSSTGVLWQNSAWMWHRRSHHRAASTLVTLLIASALFAAPLGASARSFSIPEPNPQSFVDVYKVLFGWDLLAGDEYKPNIPKFLEKTKCGGRVDMSAALSIPEVEGVPGRRGVWDGALWSGMATREDTNGDELKDNDYEFPDSAEGYALATYPDSAQCNALHERLIQPKNGDGPGCEDVDAEVRDSPMCETLTDAFGDPENEDPPGCKTPEECYDKCRVANELVYPVARPALCLHRECWAMAIEIELPEITDEDLWYEMLWTQPDLPFYPYQDLPWDDPIQIIQTITEDPRRITDIVRTKPDGPIMLERMIRIIEQDPGRLQYIVTDKANEMGMRITNGVWEYPPPEDPGYDGSYGDPGYDGSYGDPGYDGSIGDPGYDGSYGDPGYDGSTSKYNNDGGSYYQPTEDPPQEFFYMIQGALPKAASQFFATVGRWAGNLRGGTLTAELVDPAYYELRQDMDLEYFLSILTEDSLWRLADFIGVAPEELFAMERLPCIDYWDLGVLITMDDRGFVLDHHWIEEEYDTADVDYFEQREASEQMDCVSCIEDEWEDEPILDREDSYRLVGYKYHCTASVEEYATKVEWELDEEPRDERTGELFSEMMVPYGWLWSNFGETTEGHSPNIDLPEQCKERWVQEVTEYPNCTYCGREDLINVEGETEPEMKDEATPGEECRCGTKAATYEENIDPALEPIETEEAGFTEQCRLTTRTSPVNGSYYWSFFRRYLGSYMRPAPVLESGTETLSQEAEVFCFEFYNERDPKFQQTTLNDQRCIIDIDVSQLPVTNAGKGEYGEPRHGGPSQNSYDDIRPYPEGDFNQAEDLWFTSFGHAFSLLNGDLVKWDLAQALLSLDSALQAVAWQTDLTPLAEHLRIRSFDHTGQYMTTTVWSNEQTSRAQKLFRPAELHVYLPGALDFGKSSAESDEQDWSIAPEERRGAPIVLQVDSGQSVIDAVVTLLQKVYSLKFREEPLTVVTPLGSPAEFRVLAEKWCTWWILRSGSTTCDGAPGEVQALMQRFDEYADSIEDLRMLRSQLSLELGGAISSESNILGPIIDWMEQNIALFQEYIDQRNELLTFVPEWEQIEELQRSFGDTVMTPWCKNDRFLTPVYSLLDPWLYTRADHGLPLAETAAGALPSLPKFVVPTFPKDMVLDLSELHMPTAGEGGLPLPVLHVVQVKLNLEAFEPPDYTQEEAFVPEAPPSFPPVSAVLGTLEAIASSVGSPDVVVASSPPTITFPVLPRLDEVQEALTAMAPFLAQRNLSYNAFWRSIGPLKPDLSDADETTDAKEAHWCERAGDKACKHVEADLRERFQLIGAPPAVLREEDLVRWTEPRHAPDTCKPWDEACNLLHPEDIRQRTGWQVVPPDEESGEPVYDAARAALRAPWLRVPLGERSPDDALPYDVSGPDLTPAFRTPEVIELSPSGIDLSTLP